jgi:acylphosphatase
VSQTDRHDVIRHCVFRGRVQGVGYRAFVEDEATRRGLGGWVRNRRDGTVEALFAADAATVVDMVAACRQGPLGARVDAVYQREGRAEELAERGQGMAFAVLPTT